MKIIFLDFDGVINRHAENGVHPDCASILKKIIEKTNAKIVVTSSNKYSFQRKRDPVPFFESNIYKNYILLLKDYNIDIFDFTPYINQNREKEIEEYLHSHPEIENFLILDDDYTFKTYQHHQILIPFDSGLTEEHINISIDILNCKEKIKTMKKIWTLTFNLYL